MEDFKQHIVPQRVSITRKEREKNNKHKAYVVWLTGLSGSGKSTLANALEVLLFNKGVETYILDGDNIRAGLCSDLSFSEDSRSENIRRVAEVAKLFMDAGKVVITAFISPFKKDREIARKLVGEENFLEIFIECPIEECERRDVKGLYKKTRKGVIKNFTGINSPFEKPEYPDLVIKTNENTIEESLHSLTEKVTEKILR